MQTEFCDSCKEKIAEDDPRALNVPRRYDWYRLRLCGGCSGSVIEVLKDMRLIEKDETI